MNRSGSRSGLTEAARLTGTSRSTIKRRLARR